MGDTNRTPSIVPFGGYGFDMDTEVDSNERPWTKVTSKKANRRFSTGGSSVKSHGSAKKLSSSSSHQQSRTPDKTVMSWRVPLDTTNNKKTKRVKQQRQHGGVSGGKTGNNKAPGHTTTGKTGHTTTGKTGHTTTGKTGHTISSKTSKPKSHSNHHHTKPKQHTTRPHKRPLGENHTANHQSTEIPSSSSALYKPTFSNTTKPSSAAATQTRQFGPDVVAATCGTTPYTLPVHMSPAVSLNDGASSISSVTEGDKEKIRLKLWNILFRNINRAVDELYYMCEYESSTEQCTEAVSALEMCIQDFSELKNRILEQEDYEMKQKLPLAQENVPSALRMSLLSSAGSKHAAKPATSTLRSVGSIDLHDDDGTRVDARGSFPGPHTSEEEGKSFRKGVAWEVRKIAPNPSPAAALLIETTKDVILPVTATKASETTTNTKLGGAGSSGNKKKSYASVTTAKSHAASSKAPGPVHEKPQKKRLVVHLGSGEQVKQARAMSQERRKQSIVSLLDSASKPSNIQHTEKVLAEKFKDLNVCASLPSDSAWVKKPNIIPDLLRTRIVQQGIKRNQAARARNPAAVDTKATRKSSACSATNSSCGSSPASTEGSSVVSGISSFTGNSSGSGGETCSAAGDDGLLRDAVGDFADDPHGSSPSDDCVEQWFAIGKPPVAPTTTTSKPPAPADLSALPPLRWGDESVGLSEEGIAMIAPISPRKLSQSRAALPSSIREMLARSLHDKLSSPERRRPSPSETRRRQVEKQVTAQLNRAKLELQRQAKLKLQAERQEAAAKVKQEEILANEKALSEKLERAAAAREANIRKVAKKAEVENIKVNEVIFINEMTELDKGAQLHKKLEDGERRRLEYIDAKMEKAKKQSERERAAARARQLREGQLREQMEKRLEEAERRKAEAMVQAQKRLDEIHIEAPAKASERREEMVREREARLLAIKEREERAILEREKVLQNKRISSKNPKSPRNALSFDHDAFAYESASSPRAGVPVDDTSFGEAGRDERAASPVTLAPAPNASSHNATTPAVQVTSPRRIAFISNNQDKNVKTPDQVTGSEMAFDVTSSPSDDVGPLRLASADALVRSGEPQSTAAATAMTQKKRKDNKNRKKKLGKTRKSITQTLDACAPVAVAYFEVDDKASGKNKFVTPSPLKKLLRSLLSTDNLGAKRCNTVDTSMRALVRLLEQEFGRYREGAYTRVYENPYLAVENVASYAFSSATSTFQEKDIPMLERFRVERGMETALSWVTSEVVETNPKIVTSALRVLIAASYNLASIKYLLSCTRVHELVDFAVAMFQKIDGFGEGEPPMDWLHIIEYTAQLMSIIMRAMQRFKDAVDTEVDNESDENATTRAGMSRFLVLLHDDLVRYCVQSTFLNQLVEACTHLREGETWMGCSLGLSHRLLARPSSHSGNDATASSGSLASPVIGTTNSTLSSSSMVVDKFGDAMPTPVTTSTPVKLECALDYVKCVVGFTEALMCTSEPPPTIVMNAIKHVEFVKLQSLLVNTFHAVNAYVQVSSTGSVRSDSTSRRHSTMSRKLQTVSLFMLRTANYIARADLKFCQEILGSPATQFEFQQLLRNVRSSCASPAESASSLSSRRGDASEALLAELVILMGMFALNNKTNQESLNWGHSPTLLGQLCSLPFKYFSSDAGKLLLFPTMISVCFRNPTNLAIVANDIAPELLGQFVAEQRDKLVKTTSKNTRDDKRCNAQPAQLDFEQRFPREYWEEAIGFFQSTC